VTAVSFSERAKAKEPKRVTLDSYLESLPDAERAGALHMLKAREVWTIEDLVEAFRDEGAPIIGKNQFSKWRRANNVVR
jgi:hypothetical protein